MLRARGGGLLVDVWTCFGVQVVGDHLRVVLVFHMYNHITQR